MNLAITAVLIGSSIRFATPLLLGATGELLSQRAGVLNMSLEGMMLTGAFGAALGSWASGNALLGLLAAILAVLPLALLQAYLSITLGANQIVTGIGINILALGGTTLAYRDIFGSRSSAVIPGLLKWAPPGLRDIPVVGMMIFEQTWLLYLGLAIIAAIGFVLRHTALGLAIHASGADPRAVDQAGMSVARVRYGAVLFSGLMAAIAGSFISIGDIHTFTEGMTGGAGYLAIAAIIFGNWKLGRMLLACLLFGCASALQFFLPAIGVNVPSALLIMLPYVLALLAVAGLIGRQSAPTALAQPYQRA